jgi:hypothetical protein
VKFSSEGLTADSSPKADKFLGLLSLPHGCSPSPLRTPPVTNQQVSYAHVLRTATITGTLNTICVQECDLLGTDAACRRPETMLVGTDLPLSMFVALFRPLAMIVLLSTMGQAHTRNDYLTDNVSHRHIIFLLNTTFRDLRNSRQ